MAGGFATAAGADGGVTIPDDVHVFTITVGSETGPYALAAPAQMLTGQVIHIYNASSNVTTGIVTAIDGGATLVSDGTAWLQL